MGKMMAHHQERLPVPRQGSPTISGGRAQHDRCAAYAMKPGTRHLPSGFSADAPVAEAAPVCNIGCSRLKLVVPPRAARGAAAFHCCSYDVRLDGIQKGVSSRLVKYVRGDGVCCWQVMFGWLQCLYVKTSGHATRHFLKIDRVLTKYTQKKERKPTPNAINVLLPKTPKPLN